jgi:hypothetical protein
VKLFDVARTKRSLPLDEREQTFKHFRVRLDGSGNKLGIAVPGVARYVTGLDASLDQCPRDAPVKRIDALYDAGLNGPLTPQLHIELRDGLSLCQCLLL